MNKLVKQIKYFAILLLLLGMAIPWQKAAAQGSPATITGGPTACVGDTRVYAPGISDPSYAYHWSVMPAAMGTVLSGNHTGATVQWMTTGIATVRLYILDPLNTSDTLYNASHVVNVTAMPAPFITTNVELGCQPLNEDPRQKESPKFDEANCQLVCEHSTVRYFANGDVGSNYTWNITGAVSYSPSTSGDHCDVNWGAPGFGEVQLTETTIGGCETETSFCVEIIEGPQAKFETVPPSGGLITICRNGELVVQDLSTASASSPIVSYLWDWGDGHSTPMSPGAAGSPMSHVYEDPGVYVVRLTVVNSCGCVSVYGREVRVEEKEAPKIACPRVVCEGERAIYSVDRPFACAPDSWSVIGGTIIGAGPDRVEIIWNNVDPNTGFGYVMYRTCPPCEMTVTEPVPVILKRAIIQGPPVICEGKQYVYRLPKWPGVEFNWSVSGPAFIEPTDQRNEIAVRATGPGAITLTVEYASTVLKGCGGSAQMDIQILPPAVINGPAALCQNTTANFSLSGGHTGSWTLYTATGGFVASGTGPSFAYTFTTGGNYRLSAQGTTFCPPEDHIIKVVTTPALPDLITGPDRACVNIPVRYDAGAPVAGTTFHWSVGPPGGGTANPLVGDHSYITFSSLPANVTVRRVTTDGLGCTSDELSYLVDVAVPPLVIAGEDSVCHSTLETYGLNYTEGDHYQWEVLPATLGSVVSGGNTPDPQVQWNMSPPGGATATLRATVTKCGSPVFITKSVFVRSTPVITGITVTPGTTVCSGEIVTLTVNTTYPVTSGTYEVNWGDGPPVSYAHPASISYSYNTAGASSNMVFTPVVVLRDADGCLGSVSYTAPAITVKPAPVAVLSPGGALSDCGTPFPAKTLVTTVTTGIGGSENYYWNTPTPGSDPGNVAINNVANAYGSYSVTVENSVSGCSSTSNVVLILENCGGTGPGGSCGPAPTVVLAGDTANCGIISVSATVSGVPSTGHSWNAPPGVNVTYTDAGLLTAKADVAGVYTIRYTVQYDPGCFRTYSINVLVPYVPDMRSSISCDQPGGGYFISLYDHSTEYPLTPIVDIDYFRTTVSTGTYIGSGALVTTSQAPASMVRYIQRISRPGFEPCYDTLDISTPAFPNVNIWLDGAVPNPGCVADVVFNFHHTDAGAITGHLWNFEPLSDNMSDISPIGKVYNDAGPKFVSLTVTDLYGCYAQASTSVDVELNPYRGTIAAFPNPVCQGDPAGLIYNATAGGTSTLTSYTWHRENIALTTTPGNTYNVFEPGGYWVQAVGDYGCKVKSDNMVAVVVNQVPPVSISGNAGACVDQPFTLTTPDYGTSYSYDWYRGGSPEGSGTSLTQTMGTPGSHTYFVVITDIATGCKDTSATFTVTVSLPPAPPSLGFNITNCDPYEVELNAFGVAGTYNWSNGMTGTPIYTPFGGDYQVTLTDINGCVVQNSISVPRSLEEYMWVFPTGCFCAQQSSYVIGPLISLNWAWLRDGSVSSSGGWGPMAPYTLTPGHIYNMYLDNGWCQLKSDDMHYMSDTCERLPRNADGFAAGTIGYDLQLKGADRSLLEVSPNPAGNNYALAHFVLAAGSTQRSIELVDITGRVLQTHTLDNDEGDLRIELAGYASGMYNVVLRRNGTVVQTVKLSKTE